MIVTKPAHISSLLFGALVLLVAESHSLIQQQQVTRNDCKATEVEFSLLVNQLAVLRLLNESSISYSLHESELQEMRALRVELDVKTAKLNNDLLSMKNELQNMTAASLEEIRWMTEEAKQDLKEAVSNASLQQDERELEIKNELQAKKAAALNELQNMRNATINDINARNEEAKRVLNEVKEAAANVSRQTVTFKECEAGWSKYILSCYKLFTTKATHAEATAACRTNGAYLTSIVSQGENSFVAGLIESDTYIGLDDKDQEGVYTWQDGSPFSYSKWSSGQPNSSGGNQDCAEMLLSDRKWNDISCEYKADYVCEKRVQ